MAMTNVITGMDGPNRATTSSNIMTSGSDSCASSSRDSTASTQPPKYPARRGLFPNVQAGGHASRLPFPAER
jgi:hypothetical protein